MTEQELRRTAVIIPPTGRAVLCVWAARYQRMTLTLALPGQVRLKVRSIPVRDAAPCLNALEQKT